MASVRPVSSYEAVHVWAEASKHIRRALDRVETGYSEEDVLTAIQMRDMQLWLVPGYAAAVTQIQVFPQFKVLVLLYLGGHDMGVWLEDLMDAIEEYGRQMGCKYGEEYGRKGWERIGKRRGAEVTFTVMRKAL